MRKGFLLLFILFSITGFSQTTHTWTGNADGTTWDLPGNWDNNQIPGDGHIVQIYEDVTLTGTATTTPKRISIGGTDKTITFDLSLSVGNGVDTEHAFVLNSTSTVNFGVAANNRVFNIQTATTKNAINVFGSQSNVNINIASSTIINITQCNNGMNIAGTNTTVTNNGSVNISGVSSDAVRNVGATSCVFNNYGNITINAAGSGSDGIENSAEFNHYSGTISISEANVKALNNNAGATFYSTGSINVTDAGLFSDDGIYNEGSFTNDSGGSISVTKPGDDCIEVASGASFTNDGDISVIIEDGATTNNNGLAIEGTFTNNSNNSILADGGVNTGGRAIYVYSGGTLENNGMIELDGGNDGSRLYSQGTVNNNKGATIDFRDGRANVNAGALTNNGFLISTRGSSGIFCTSVDLGAVNNGFFDYLDNTIFAVGTGNYQDNGLSLSDGAASINTADDGDGDACTADIAEMDYNWSEVGGTNSFQADANGKVTFGTDELENNPATFTSTEYGTAIEITVNDICADALAIEWGELNAKLINDQVFLSWHTFSEVNTKSFVIERSKDLKTFQAIGEVEAKGSVATLTDYFYSDILSLPGDYYYRILQIGLDGQFFHSDVLKLRMDHSGLNKNLAVYPTELRTGELININFKNELPRHGLSIQIFDMSGRIILRDRMQSNRFQIEINNSLNNGIYQLIAYDGLKYYKQRFLIIH